MNSKIIKKIIYLFTCFLLIGYSLNAQVRKDNKEKIKTLKIGYITEQLDLTEPEAEQFWPIYNLFDKKLMTLKAKERTTLKQELKENLNSLSEEESKVILKKIEDFHKLFYETKEQMYLKLAKVIGYKKVLKLELAEKEFHRKLIRKLRSKENH